MEDGEIGDQVRVGEMRIGGQSELGAGGQGLGDRGVRRRGSRRHVAEARLEARLDPEQRQGQVAGGDHPLADEDLPHVLAVLAGGLGEHRLVHRYLAPAGGERPWRRSAWSIFRWAGGSCLPRPAGRRATADGEVIAGVEVRPGARKRSKEGRSARSRRPAPWPVCRCSRPGAPCGGGIQGQVTTSRLGPPERPRPPRHSPHDPGGRRAGGRDGPGLPGTTLQSGPICGAVRGRDNEVVDQARCGGGIRRDAIWACHRP